MEQNQLAEELRRDQEYPKDPTVSRIPASEEDRLSTAVSEGGAESAHSQTSQRAEAAWDAVPGEEISVDFPDAGYEPLPEVTPLKKEGFTVNYLQGQVGQMLEVKPELSVDVYVNLPDGRSWNLNLAVPEGDSPLDVERVLELVVDHFDAAEAMLQRALRTSPRRSVLGLPPRVTE